MLIAHFAVLDASSSWRRKD